MSQYQIEILTSKSYILLACVADPSKVHNMFGPRLKLDNVAHSSRNLYRVKNWLQISTTVVFQSPFFHNAAIYLKYKWTSNASTIDLCSDQIWFSWAHLPLRMIVSLGVPLQYSAAAYRIFGNLPCGCITTPRMVRSCWICIRWSIIQSNEVWRAQVEPLCPHLQQQ